MSINKKVAFKDIREGDKIRVADVRDFKVSENRTFELLAQSAENGEDFRVLETSPSGVGNRIFTLLEREHNPLPTKRGSVIEVDTERFILVYDQYAPTDLWVSSRTGARLDPPRLQLRADAADGFEVIA